MIWIFAKDRLFLQKRLLSFAKGGGSAAAGAEEAAPKPQPEKKLELLGDHEDLVGMESDKLLDAGGEDISNAEMLRRLKEIQSLKKEGSPALKATLKRYYHGIYDPEILAEDVVEIQKKEYESFQKRCAGKTRKTCDEILGRNTLPVFKTAIDSLIGGSAVITLTGDVQKIVSNINTNHGESSAEKYLHAMKEKEDAEKALHAAEKYKKEEIEKLKTELKKHKEAQEIITMKKEHWDKNKWAFVWPLVKLAFKTAVGVTVGGTILSTGKELMSANSKWENVWNAFSENALLVPHAIFNISSMTTGGLAVLAGGLALTYHLGLLPGSNIKERSGHWYSGSKIMPPAGGTAPASIIDYGWFDYFRSKESSLEKKIKNMELEEDVKIKPLQQTLHHAEHHVKEYEGKLKKDHKHLEDEINKCIKESQAAKNVPGGKTAVVIRAELTQGIQALKALQAMFLIAHPQYQEVGKKLISSGHAHSDDIFNNIHAMKLPMDREEELVKLMRSEDTRMIGEQEKLAELEYEGGLKNEINSLSDAEYTALRTYLEGDLKNAPAGALVDAKFKAKAKRLHEALTAMWSFAGDGGTVIVETQYRRQAASTLLKLIEVERLGPMRGKIAAMLLRVENKDSRTRSMIEIDPGIIIKNFMMAGGAAGGIAPGAPGGGPSAPGISPTAGENFEQWIERLSAPDLQLVAGRLQFMITMNAIYDPSDGLLKKKP